MDCGKDNNNTRVVHVKRPESSGKYPYNARSSNTAVISLPPTNREVQRQMPGEHIPPRKRSSAPRTCMPYILQVHVYDVLAEHLADHLVPAPPPSRPPLATNECVPVAHIDVYGVALREVLLDVPCRGRIEIAAACGAKPTVDVTGAGEYGFGGGECGWGRVSEDEWVVGRLVW